MTKRRIYLALALTPLLLILIPAFLGYFLYSPINNGWIQVGWFGLFTWLWWQETKKADELESFIFPKIVLGVVGLSLILGYGTANLGAGMEEEFSECSGNYYQVDMIGGGLFDPFAYGGGIFRDTNILFYKTNRPNPYLQTEEYRVCRDAQLEKLQLEVQERYERNFPLE